MSTKGAMMLSTSALTSAGKAKRKKKLDGYARIDPSNMAITGEELRQNERNKRRRIDAAKNRVMSNNQGPERPNQDLKEIGKRGDKKSFTQMVMKHRTKNTIVNTDPREALLKYHNTDSGTNWIGDAYAKSDPTRVLADTTLEEEEEEEVAAARKD